MKKIRILSAGVLLAVWGAVPAWAAEESQGSLGDFLLGTVEGAMLLALLLTAIFMAGYAAWRRRKKKK